MRLKQAIKVLEEHHKGLIGGDVNCISSRAALSRAIKELNKLLTPEIEDGNFCKEYHSRKESRGKLIITDIRMLPERDGNCMDLANELIREGWELTKIEDLSKFSEISTETVKLVFCRWINYGS